MSEKHVDRDLANDSERVIVVVLVNSIEKDTTMKTKKSASKKSTSTRNAIPYEKIAEMAEAGMDATTIAKKTDRLLKGDDPTHSIRAIISKMRTSGWKDKEGKVRKLKVERLGVVKAVKTPKKKGAAKKAAIRPKSVSQIDGKTLAAGGVK